MVSLYNNQYRDKIPVHNKIPLLVKVKLSLCLTKPHTMKMYLVLNKAPCHENVWGKERDTFLTSALDTGEWSASCCSNIILRERVPSTYWIKG
jgi:hypothetical protein